MVRTKNRNRRVIEEPHLHEVAFGRLVGQTVHAFLRKPKECNIQGDLVTVQNVLDPLHASQRQTGIHPSVIPRTDDSKTEVLL